MTEPVPPLAEEVPAKKPKRRVKIDPAGDPGGTLEQLLIENKRLSDAATEAGEEANTAKAAVKAYLLDVCGADPKGLPDAIDVAGDPHGRYPGYTMTLKGGRRFDQAAFREFAGDELYERFETDITPSWELRPSQQGQGRRRK